MSTFGHRFGRRNGKYLDPQPVVGIGWNAIFNIKRPAAKAARLCDNSSVVFVRRFFDMFCNAFGEVLDIRGHAGHATAIAEAACRRKGPCDHPNYSARSTLCNRAWQSAVI